MEAALGIDDISVIPQRYAGLDRKHVYHQGLRVGKALMEDEIKHRHGVFSRATNNYTFINDSPYGLHPAMFIPALKTLASDEQLAHWLPLAEGGNIVGIYCQTELGHGTFVRGLETTATFDVDNDEFIINSPTVTSTKYWPGGLGYSCSHAIVMAQLVIGNKSLGVHPFMLQVRSLKDFSPMPGIELGEIGLKLGLNQTDNGYAIFSECRIPRSNLLMRNAQVLPGGEYIRASHDKLVYATMLYTRNSIAHTVTFQLAQAATIAIRYSTVREQGLGAQNLNSNGQEAAIISYQSQYVRLLTHMARAYSLAFACKSSELMYQKMLKSQLCGDHHGLAYSHATVAALKAYSTQIAADGAEDCRKCCGGHGYSVLSGLPDIVTSVTSTTTLEGENYVMYQQTARYLIKMAAAVRDGKPVDPPVQYLADRFHVLYPDSAASQSVYLTEPVLPQYPDHAEFDVTCLQNLVDIMEIRVTRLIFECESSIRFNQTQQQQKAEDTFNDHMLRMITVARAYIELFVMRSFVAALSGLVTGIDDTMPSYDLDKASRDALYSLVIFNALEIITTSQPLSPSFLELTSLTPNHIKLMRQSLNDMAKRLLPDAVGFADAWGFTDGSLASALGVRDGNVYETLMSWTKQLPIDQEAKENGGIDKDGFLLYTKPLLSKL